MLFSLINFSPTFLYGESLLIDGELFRAKGDDSLLNGEVTRSFFLLPVLRALSCRTMIAFVGLLGLLLFRLLSVSLGRSIGLKMRKPDLCSLSCMTEVSTAGSLTPFFGVWTK